MQKAITRLTGRSKNPKLPWEARHTRPLDALGLRCEIDGKRQTPGGQRLQASQTGLKHTLATEKEVAKQIQAQTASKTSGPKNYTA